MAWLSQLWSWISYFSVDTQTDFTISLVSLSQLNTWVITSWSLALPMWQTRNIMASGLAVFLPPHPHFLWLFQPLKGFCVCFTLPWADCRTCDTNKSYRIKAGRASISSSEESFSHQLNLVLLKAADQHFGSREGSSQLYAVCRHKVITEGVLHTVSFFLSQWNLIFFAISLCLSLYLQ